jgi:glycerol-3-phosphate acyltransferase PlsX
LRIAVDAMGGDHAPGQIVLGSARAASELGLEVVVVGQPAVLEPIVKEHRVLDLAPAEQVVGMDEPPAAAVRGKPDSSMAVCARMCKQGQADAWVSAGNSGAVMAAALLIQGRVRGVDRPAFGALLPTRAKPCYLVDVGANVDSRPEFLVQFAAMASAYAVRVLGRPAPRLGLLANGEEDSKGDQLVRETHKRLRESQLATFEFIGNIEPKDLLAGRADVVIADGFVGNVALKTAEATVELILGTLREEIPRTLSGKLGGLLIRPGVKRVRDRLDWREYGGAPVLGVDGVAVVAHGRSDAWAIRNAIRTAGQAVESGLVRSIQEAVGQ